MTGPRTPETVPPRRIDDLAVLPLFHKLTGRRVVLAGDGEAVVWKADLLAATGADLQVFAPGGLVFAGPHRLHRRRWTPADLAGAALAVAETADDTEAAAFAAAARAAGVPVNVVDRPEFCDFAFGAIVNRSPLVVAIATDGGAPVLARAIRAKIEALLPASLKAWAAAAAAWRPAVAARGFGAEVRRSFWERFAGRALTADGEPGAGELDRLLAGFDPGAAAGGRITLVGAGPGDPELLTLKAVRALQSADVILFDDLVAAGVLEFARREAERILVGKTGHGPSCRQEDIDRLLVDLARRGRHVVRLKSGDPCIFGRADEEIAAARAAGIPVTVVPGISAAQGAAAGLGVSLTRRGTARRLQFVTGHGRDGRLPADLDWNALADPRATTALYMGRATIADFCAGILAAGLPATTPAAAIVAATRPDERRVVGTLAGLQEMVGELPATGPLLVLIGEVIADIEETEISFGRDSATAR